MNRNELKKQVQEDLFGYVSKLDVALVMDVLFHAMERELLAGNTVTVSGFGTFTVVKHEARICRNPKTGDRIISKEKLAVKFTQSKGFFDERKNG